MVSSCSIHVPSGPWILAPATPRRCRVSVPPWCSTPSHRPRRPRSAAAVGPAAAAPRPCCWPSHGRGEEKGWEMPWESATIWDSGRFWGYPEVKNSWNGVLKDVFWGFGGFGCGFWGQMGVEKESNYDLTWDFDHGEAKYRFPYWFITRIVFGGMGARWQYLSSAKHFDSRWQKPTMGATKEFAGQNQARLHEFLSSEISWPTQLSQWPIVSLPNEKHHRSGFSRASISSLDRQLTMMDS